MKTYFTYELRCASVGLSDTATVVIDVDQCISFSGVLDHITQSDRTG